jgi:hypothetical protein
MFLCCSLRVKFRVYLLAASRRRVKIDAEDSLSAHPTGQVIWRSASLRVHHFRASASTVTKVTGSTDARHSRSSSKSAAWLQLQ